MAEDDMIRHTPVDPTKRIAPVPEQGEFDKQLSGQQPAPFSLSPQSGQQALSPQKTEAPTPMTLASGQAAAQAMNQPTTPQVAQNMQNLVDQINQAKQDLQTKGVDPSDSAQQIYRYRLNRLQHNLDVISNRVGAPQMSTSSSAQTAETSDQSPLETYLSYLTDGQNQLNSAMDTLNKLGNSDNPVSPGDLMAVQIKVNSAQQEIQFFSALLGQSLDSMKQLMNTQM